MAVTSRHPSDAALDVLAEFQTGGPSEHKRVSAALKQLEHADSALREAVLSARTPESAAERSVNGLMLIVDPSNVTDGTTLATFGLASASYHTSATQCEMLLGTVSTTIITLLGHL
jgi:hypothetical protein